ncbi:MAG TPA: VOC family protein [Burkholderiaceae bacterium]
MPAPDRPNTIHEIFPYLRVRDANAAVRFYTAAFGAVERFRLSEPSGRIGHVELQFGPAVVMLSDPFPEYGIHAPAEGEDGGASVHLHVDDADAMIERAVEAGATLLMAPQDQFYGERSGKVRCPFGTTWLIGHSIEALDPAEMQRRYTALMQQEGSAESS